MREVGDFETLSARSVLSFSLQPVQFSLALCADHKCYVAALELVASICLADVQHDLKHCL